MNRQRLCAALVAAGLVLWIACESRRTVPERVFQSLESADRMDITTTTKQVRSIVAPWRIRKTAHLLQHYAQGWQRPLSGTPLPELIVNFLKGKDLLWSFGIGHDYITMGEDHLWCQPLVSKDREEFLDWLAVKEQAGAAP